METWKKGFLKTRYEWLTQNWKLSYWI